MAGRMLPPVVATLSANDDDLDAALDNADARMVTTAALMDDLGKDHKLNLDLGSTGSTNSDLEKTALDLDNVTQHAIAMGAAYEDSAGKLHDASGKYTSASTLLRKLGEDGVTTAEDIKKIEPAADGASGGIDRLKKSASDASNSLGGGGSGGGGLLASLLPLAPALLPIAGVATGAGIALAGMATAGIAGIGAFALAAGPQLTTMKTEMGGLLTSFQAVNAPTVLPVLNNAVGLFGTALQAANPLVGATSTALLNLEGRAKSALQSPSWANFTTFIDAEAGPSITTFGTVLGNLGHGLGNLLIAFAPVETQMETGLVHLSQGFLNWTSSTGGLHTFVTWFQSEGPQVAQLIGNLGHVVTDLLPAFTMWGGVMIQVANPLLSLVNDLFKVNPVIGDITAALIIGGLAWSKWGSAISGAVSVVRTLAPRAAEAAGSLIGIGTAGGEGATGLAALAASATGSTVLIAGVAAAAALAAGYFGGMTIASALNKGSADALNAAVARMTATMSGAGTTTIPQMSQAITANTALMADLTNKQLGAGASTDGLTAKQHEAVAAYTQNNVAGASYVASMQKITAENKTLFGSILTQNANLDLLSSKYGITKTSALDLANTLGLNLNKQLTGLQVTQVGAEFDQMSQSAGITQTALNNLAMTANTKMSVVSQAINSAEAATQKSFSAAGDLVTAFSGQTAVTGQQIQLFYGSAVSQAQSFTANIRTAITDGYDPTLISQLLTAGPAQAGPLLQSLVDNVSNGMVGTVKSATAALSTLNAQAVQQQRITYEAVTAGSSQMAADVTNAFAIQQEAAREGAGATVASVNQQLGLGLNTVQQISDEYSLGLPTAFQQQQVNAYLMAQAQGAMAGAGVQSQVPLTQLAAAAHAAAVPNAIQQQQANAYLQALAQGNEVSGGLNAATGTVGGAAAFLAQVAEANLSIADQTGKGQSAGQQIADGLNSRLPAVSTAAAALAAAASGTSFTPFIPHALGGTFTTPHLGLIAEAGTETILPWNDPGRVAQLLGAMPASAFSALDAGLSASGGAGALVPAVAGGQGGPVTININVSGANQDTRSLALAIRNELLQVARNNNGIGLS